MSQAEISDMNSNGSLVINLCKFGTVIHNCGK